MSTCRYFIRIIITSTLFFSNTAFSQGISSAGHIGPAGVDGSKMLKERAVAKKLEDMETKKGVKAHKVEQAKGNENAGQSGESGGDKEIREGNSKVAYDPCKKDPKPKFCSG